MPILSGKFDDLVEESVKILSSGDVLAIPTETVYGLAADITIPDALDKIFSMKNRPTKHPLIVHIADKTDLARYAIHIPSYVENLINHFWPGPLTLVLQKSDLINPIITGGQETVAIRMPNHPLTLALIKRLGHPLAAPSANKFGQISPTRPEHVISEFDNQINVLEGGACAIGIESTIVNATQPDYFSILRPGHISSADLVKAIDQDKKIRIQDSAEAIAVPGKLLKHYSPRKPLKIFTHSDELLDFHNQYIKVYTIHYSDLLISSYLDYRIEKEVSKFAQQIYHQLRVADQSSALAIAVEAPPTTTEWLPIWDRLAKAAFSDSPVPCSKHACIISN